MKGSIIVYQTSNLSRHKATKFSRELHGYKDRSNKGRYVYHRPGLLDEIPSRELIRGAVIIKRRDLDKVLEFMKSYDAKVYARTVELTARDEEILKSKE
ncbi:hypothetical protein AKJ48_03995 [candidate division MSBL1 archaeon SCGC-AAA261O19]|uniref:Uncharacterized protein n=1 Tax=candidate division MSBL1 archaeon SCGC-AAA261O19 TaxID=1698277 RepID=A0A133VA79_9EURY|nr:hypothetical protein AKJ48_03995 [candidate division MSBL1 archaeon SCGC-AAA261O19]